MYVCMYVCICVYTYIHTPYVCMYVCMYVSPKAINFKFHGHIPYPLGMNPIENEYCWMADMAAILDIV